MGKKLILILALVLVAGLTAAAYAEVQNVKVSGDLTMSAVSRNNIDLNKTRQVLTAARTADDEQDNFLTIARVKIDADLTDNVATTVRLINERDWNDEGTVAASNDIELDLAYVNLKEFLYSPLTLTVGRQELRYGNGMVIGDPDTNSRSLATGLTQDDLSLRKAFDAVKAVLNYDPLVVDLVYAKIDENSLTAASADDVELMGVNAAYVLNKETNLGAYLFSKKAGKTNTVPFTAGQRTRTEALSTVPDNVDVVNTIGLSVANSSLKNLNLGLEYARQFGTYNPLYDINSLTQRQGGDRKAWALQANAAYDLKDVSLISKYAPSIGANYAYFSGEEHPYPDDIVGKVTGDYKGWDPMFEDQTFGKVANRIMAQTNQQVLNLCAKAAPIEDVKLAFDYSQYWLNEAFPDNGKATVGKNTTNLRGVAGAPTYRMTGDKNLGQEFDLTLTYDYTEDVQLSLLGGLFVPGDAFHQDNESNASEVIGSMKVSF